MLDIVFTMRKSLGHVNRRLLNHPFPLLVLATKQELDSTAGTPVKLSDLPGRTIEEAANEGARDCTAEEGCYRDRLPELKNFTSALGLSV